MIDGPHFTPRRRWLTPTATAAGVAIVVTGVLLAVNRAPTPEAGADAPDAGPHDLLVRDGDEVTAKGVVLAPPDGPVVFCPPLPRADIGHPPGAEPLPPCLDDPRAVVVTGVDLDRLRDQETRDGVRFGYAELRGIWRDRTIAVTHQAPYSTDPGPSVPRDDEVPCPRPPGDWKQRSELPNRDTDQVTRFVDSRPDRFGAIRVAYVDVADEAPNSGPDWPGAKEILVVGVAAGDLDRARRDLESRYAGNLCVTHIDQSTTTRRAVGSQLERLRDTQPESVISTAGISLPRLLPSIELVVLDQTVHDALAPIGWDQFQVKVVIRPLG